MIRAVTRIIFAHIVCGLLWFMDVGVAGIDVRAFVRTLGYPFVGCEF